MIRAIIVDDEPYCCDALVALLADHTNVQIVSVCHNADNAIQAIQKLNPDLLFLDVEMPRMNGFQMLEQIPSVKFDIIFTTSYDQYALKAIRFSAMDYLLKPVDEEELKRAMQKVTRRAENVITEQLGILMQKVQQSKTPVNKIALPTMEGLQMIKIDTIVSCESDNNYTMLKLKNGNKMLVCRTLKDMKELLEEHSFARVHRCYLANLNEVEKYVKGDGGYLIMSDGTTIDVSRNKKEELLKQLLPYKE